MAAAESSFLKNNNQKEETATGCWCLKLLPPRLRVSCYFLYTSLTAGTTIIFIIIIVYGCCRQRGLFLGQLLHFLGSLHPLCSWPLVPHQTFWVVQKTFIGEEKKALSQVAGEILSFFTRNNFVVTDRGETITFEGMMVPSRGQAALLTFCTCISLASVALVLTITVPDVGNNWFWITPLSPLAGAYYWKRASRKEQIKVKMMVIDDDGAQSEIIVQGDDQQVGQMTKELQLSEKGMVYVKGIFER